MSSAGERARGFATTRWSVVLAAVRGRDGRRALGELCVAYWYPVYAYVRRRGHAESDAADLTQGFFARLLERGGLAGVDAARGRFRGYLLGCVQHYLANERDRAAAHRRGGARGPVSLDALAPEQRYRVEPVDGESPERVFEHAFAMTLLETALERLAAEHYAGERAPLLEALKPALMGEEPRYAELALDLGTTEGALKVAAHRLRRRFAECLRASAADTLGPRDDVEDELRQLFRALAPGKSPPRP